MLSIPVLPILVRALRLVTKSCLLGPLRLVIDPYKASNAALVPLQVIWQRLDGFFFWNERETPFKVVHEMHGQDLLVLNARDWWAKLMSGLSGCFFSDENRERSQFRRLPTTAT